MRPRISFRISFWKNFITTIRIIADRIIQLLWKARMGCPTLLLIDEGDHYRMYIGILRNVNPNYTYPHVIRDLFLLQRCIAEIALEYQKS